MNGRNLQSMIDYIGQERNAREIVINDKLAPTSEVALMTDVEVYDVLTEKYTAVFKCGEKIALVENERLEEFESMIVYLER